jgi:hypothetical protein
MSSAQSVSASQTPVERWTSARLAELVPGSTRKWWHVSMVPTLVAAGVLRKVGNAWLGRRSAIEAALLAPSKSGARS